jgi:hypothetical protein
MLLFALPKGALGRSILGFAFLMLSDTYVTRHTGTTYGCGLRGQRLAAWLLGLFVFTFSALPTALIVVSVVVVVGTLALVARVLAVPAGGRTAGERADHQIVIGIVKVEAIIAVEVVNKRTVVHADTTESICGRSLLRRREEGGVNAIQRVLVLRVIQGSRLTLQVSREEVVRVLFVGGESSQEKILLGRVEVEGRAALEVVGSSSHCDQRLVRGSGSDQDGLGRMMLHKSTTPGAVESPSGSNPGSMVCGSLVATRDRRAQRRRPCR